MAEDLTNAGGVIDPRWSAAVTLEQLGELVAEWLEGRIKVPIYGDGPDPETAALVPFLAQLNRSGFVTFDSQPGEIDGEWSQRATVAGYCQQDVAERLASVSLRQDLVVISQRGGPGRHLPASDHADAQLHLHHPAGNHAPTWVEDSWPWPDLHPNMRSGLLSGWCVDVCDPVWGRNDVLWPALTAALSYSVEQVVRSSTTTTSRRREPARRRLGVG